MAKKKKRSSVVFFGKLAGTSNISMMVCLCLNVGMIATIFSLIGMSLLQAFLAGILLYAAGLCAALSPFGENLLRFQTGCRRITDEEEKNKIMPLFLEVYAKARVRAPSIPEDVRLFMNEKEEPNAFATGRKTICVTRGLLKLPPSQIKAVLAHEFGHLAHKDTCLLLVGGLAWPWTKIGLRPVKKTNRESEFEADAFAYRLGFGDVLCACLDKSSGGMGKGLFANLVTNHPSTVERIVRLRNLAQKEAYTGK